MKHVTFFSCHGFPVLIWYRVCISVIELVIPQLTIRYCISCARRKDRGWSIKEILSIRWPLGIYLLNSVLCCSRTNILKIYITKLTDFKISWQTYSLYSYPSTMKQLYQNNVLQGASMFADKAKIYVVIYI